MSTGKSFARGLLSAVLCVMLFMFISVFTALLLLRADNAATIIRNTDISEIIADTEIAYYLVNQLNNLSFHETDIDLQDIESFLHNEAVSNEIGGVLSDYARALNNNDMGFHLTTGDILVIVENLEPELSDLFDHHMTEEDNILLARTLDDILDFEGLTVGGIIYDVGIDTTVPRLLLSPYLLWGTGILVFITLSFIVIHNLNSIPSAFMQSGIPITISGFLYLITGVIFSDFPGLLSGRLHTLSRYVVGAMHLVIRYGIVITAVGVTFIVIYLIMRNRQQ